MNVFEPRQQNTFARARTHARTYTHIQTYTHVHARTHTHTYTHTHTQSSLFFSVPAPPISLLSRRGGGGQSLFLTARNNTWQTKDRVSKKKVAVKQCKRVALKTESWMEIHGWSWQDSRAKINHNSRPVKKQAKCACTTKKKSRGRMLRCHSFFQPTRAKRLCLQSTCISVHLRLKVLLRMSSHLPPLLSQPLWTHSLLLPVPMRQCFPLPLLVLLLLLPVLVLGKQTSPEQPPPQSPPLLLLHGTTQSLALQQFLSGAQKHSSQLWRQRHAHTYTAHGS